MSQKKLNTSRLSIPVKNSTPKLKLNSRKTRNSMEVYETDNTAIAKAVEQSLANSSNLEEDDLDESTNNRSFAENDLVW
jgi:hypothetical protein